MLRHTCQPRAQWRDRVSAVGLTYHSHDEGPYWDEGACYEFSRAEIESLELAGRTLHQLCLEAAGKVVEKGWWSRLGLPEQAIPAIERSWERDDFSLYGRFDLAFVPGGAPKMLEYNADTPTALVEASVAQWFWLQETRPEADQFNSIHERLIEAWRRWSGSTLHFSSIHDHPEDEQTTLYLRDTCEQAGVRTRGLPIEEIGWDPRQQRFVGLEFEPIDRCFKLYPWEWMWHEPFAPHLGIDTDGTRFIEPAWKMLLAGKGLLPILWELFPDHPNLLPAFETPERLGASYVRKPRWSREGANVTWIDKGQTLEQTGGEYGSEGFVYQAPAALPCFDGHHPVVGLWIVDHEPAGMGLREDTRRITSNLSRFVPHFFR